MRRVVGALFTVLLLLPSQARAEEPAPACPPCPSPADETDFAEHAARFARLEVFTRRLEEARAREAFEASAERYAKLESMHRELEERDVRAFDAQAETYARLITLTRELAREQDAADAAIFDEKLALALRVSAFFRALARGPAPEGPVHTWVTSSDAPPALEAAAPELADEPLEWAPARPGPR